MLEQGLGRARVGARWGVMGSAAVLSVVGGLLLFFAVRIWLASQIPTPWIMSDELVYSEFARNLADGAWNVARGEPTSLVGVLYPTLIAPAWLAPSVASAYTVAKVANVLVMSLAAIPVYLWARRLVPALWASVATVLVLMLPAFLYTGTLMTENAALPTFLLAAFALALALERTTPRSQLLALLAIGLACTVRLQALVFLLIFPSAVFLRVALDLRFRHPNTSRLRAAVTGLRAFWPSAAIVAGALVLYALQAAARGRALADGLGSYQDVAQRGYSAGEAIRWVGYHFAELPLSVGIVPASALVVLLVLAFRRGSAEPAERAFLAVAAASTFWLVVQAGVFASRFSLRVEERNMLYAAPLLLLALVVWLARGLPRPPITTALAVAVPAGLLALLPLPSLLNISILSDTFALIPLYALDRNAGVGGLWLSVALGAVLFAAFFALVPRRLATVALPFLTAALLGLTTAFTFIEIHAHAEAVRDASGVGDDLSWIDEAIGPDAAVAFLYSPAQSPHVLWQTEFWNRSIRDVYTFGAPDPSGLSQRPVDPPAGLLAGQPGLRYVVADATFEVAGARVVERGQLSLYRVEGPARVVGVVDGVYPDGWMGGAAAYTRYSTPGNRGGTILVQLSRLPWRGPSPPGNVVVRIGPIASTPAGPVLARATTEKTWRLHSRELKVLSLEAPPPPFRVEVTIVPTFVAADYPGWTDTREHGAKVSFRFRP
jgi:hypothetical protein